MLLNVSYIAAANVVELLVHIILAVQQHGRLAVMYAHVRLLMLLHSEPCQCMHWSQCAFAVSLKAFILHNTHSMLSLLHRCPFLAGTQEQLLQEGQAELRAVNDHQQRQVTFVRQSFMLHFLMVAHVLCNPFAACYWHCCWLVVALQQDTVCLDKQLSPCSCHGISDHNVFNITSFLTCFHDMC